MKNLPLLKTFTVFLLLLFISLFDASIGRVSAQECADNEKTDKAITEEIYAAIKNHRNKKLAKQLSHLNISSKNRVIKLQGWAENSKLKKRIIAIANKAKCRKMVYSALFAVGEKAYADVIKKRNAELNAKVAADGGAAPMFMMRAGGDCPDGGKKCGDICIDDGDPCNGGFDN